MQYYVKSAGRGYDQDYTWVQFAGEPGDRTDVLRRMSRFLSMKTLSLALFWQDSKFYLLAGGLKSGRTDIVGTPITDTFAFVCPTEEEEKIRFLTAGIAGTHPALMQLLCSATCEDVQMSSGFRVSEDFVNALQVWPANGGISISALLEKEPEPFAGKLMHLLQNCLPEHIQNILLINSDSESRQDFYVFCSKKNDFNICRTLGENSKITNLPQEEQASKEVNMEIQNTENSHPESVYMTPNIKIYLNSAPLERSADYLWWNKSKPVWAENIENKLFYVEIPRKGFSFGVAVERREDSYCVYLQDEIAKVGDLIGRVIKIKLLFEIPAQMEGISDKEIEQGIRSICADWATADVEYGNKVVRCILDTEALVFTQTTLEVDETKIKQILWDSFRNCDRQKDESGTQEIFCLDKELSGFSEARSWFLEKLQSTCFVGKESLLCYFTGCEVADPGKVSYGVNWSRKESSEIIRPVDNTPSAAKGKGEIRPKVKGVPQRKNTNKNVLLIGAAVVILFLILILKSCGGAAENEEKRTENKISTTQNTVKKENVINSDKK